MQPRLTRAGIVALLGTTMALPAAMAQQGYSAKSLFFGTDGAVVAVPTTQAASAAVAAAPASKAIVVATAKPAAKPSAGTTKTASAMGASYFIRLKNADGSSRDVLATRTFKSGERFQLGLKVNKPTYVYILNEDPDGKVTQLYPSNGQNGLVDAMGVVFLPAQGAFEFDGVPGIEQLSVVMSPKPLTRALDMVRSSKPDLISDPTPRATAVAGAAAPACPTDRTTMASADMNYAAKGINYSADAPSACGPAFASKAIIFTDDPAPSGGGQVASYVVKPKAQPDDQLHLKLKLLHK